MGIIYRNQKNEPLTIEEMDGNFAHLDQRIKFLEDNPSMAEGIAKVSQEGDQLMMYGTCGSTLGKVTLPKLIPSFKGTWQSKTNYYVFDFIQIHRSLFSCTQAHISNVFEDDKQNWTLVFEA